MTDFPTYWQRVLAANPALATAAKITLTVEEYRKCLERAYRDGQKVSSTGDVFQLLFGGKQQ